jgi:hypothetical protein
MVKHKVLDWKSWLYGLGAGAIGGGSAVISAIPIAQIIGAAAFTPRQMLSMFIGATVIAGAAYLKQSPLPPVIEVDDGAA